MVIFLYVHFCLAATQMYRLYKKNYHSWSFFYIIYTFLFGVVVSKQEYMYLDYVENYHKWPFFYIIYTFLARRDYVPGELMLSPSHWR